MKSLKRIFNEHRRISEVMYGKNNTASTRVYRFPACTESQSNGQAEVAEKSIITGNPNILEYVNTKVIKSVF